MNAQIESLFADLKASDSEVQVEATLVLGCLMERSLWPGRHDAEHLVFLPPKLASLKLNSKGDLEPFIERMRHALESPDVSINAKLGLSTALAKTGREICLKTILQLLKSKVETLSDEQAYGLIAAILPRSSLSLLKEYETTLNQLLARGSERLNQPVTMALRAIHKN